MNAYHEPATAGNNICLPKFSPQPYPPASVLAACSSPFFEFPHDGGWVFPWVDVKTPAGAFLSQDTAAGMVEYSQRFGEGDRCPLTRQAFRKPGVYLKNGVFDE